MDIFIYMVMLAVLLIGYEKYFGKSKKRASLRRKPPVTEKEQPTKKPRTTAKNIFKWPESGSYQQEVVGESNYQRALRSLWNESQNGPLDALLVHEDTNQYDSNAVAIKIANKKVGYLSSDDAVDFRERCEEEHVGPVSSCKAKLFSKKGKEGPIGVWLDI